MNFIHKSDIYSTWNDFLSFLRFRLLFFFSSRACVCVMLMWFKHFFNLSESNQVIQMSNLFFFMSKLSKIILAI